MDAFRATRQPEAESPYLKYYWSGGIELVLMMCEYVHHTNDETFARSDLLPVAEAVMEFFDLHYPRDAGGKIRFEPRNHWRRGTKRLIRCRRSPAWNSRFHDCSNYH